MTERSDQVDVLSRGLDQLEVLLQEVPDGDHDRPTPCAEWTLADLLDHVIRGTGAFAEVVRGEDVDWSAPTPHVASAWAIEFRARADELVAAWAALGEGDAPTGPDWQSAEVAVHTWDLARTLDRSTEAFDAEVARRGLAFMRANLRPEMRTFAFGPEQPAPPAAGPYDEIAAFAGRRLDQPS